MHEGKVAGKVVIGPAGDFKNLDAAVFDAASCWTPGTATTPTWSASWVQAAARQVFPAGQHHQAPSETLAADIVISQKRVGGLQAVQVPFFPENGLFITTLDNLSVYWQRGGRRRYIVENPKRNRVEDYQSSNDDYVVEDIGLAPWSKTSKSSRPKPSRAAVSPHQAAALSATTGKRIMQLTPAQRHRARVLAAKAQAESPFGIEVQGSEYELMMAKLAADKRTLKNMESVQLKRQAKAAMLPDYLPWIEGA
jgi:hypothetical protein